VLGILLTAMLAALASTIDTHLNWGASYFTNDLYKRFYCLRISKREPSERELVRVARLSNVVLLLLSLALMTRLSSIQTAWQASLLLGAGMGIVLVLRWVWWRITALAEIAAIVASFVLAPLLMLFVPAEQEALRLLLMAFGSTAAAWLAVVSGPREPRDRLVAFYRRARPPGFWGPIAEAAAIDPAIAVRRLRRGAIATLTGSITLFFGLTAMGSFIAGSPGPVAWPWSPTAFSCCLAIVAVALVPIWLRLGFPGEDEAPDAAGS
jgi:hypothetical protein